jgi:hypothetical protein
MEPVRRAASAVARWATGRLRISSRRRQIRPDIEVLDRRVALSSATYTWSGLGDGTTYSLAANWQQNQVPPAGSLVFFPAISALPRQSNGDPNLTMGTILVDTADVSSLTVEDTYTFTADTHSKGKKANFTLDKIATLDAASRGNVLTFANSLQVTILGTVAETGDGEILLSQNIVYPGGYQLTPFTIGSGTMVVQTPGLPNNLIVVDPLATLLVLDNASSTIGGLSGSGTIQVGQHASGTQTLLNITTPRGESDVFTGTIDGAGGTVQLNGLGSLTLDYVNYDPQTQSVGTGAFDLMVASGTMLVNDRADIQTLTVGTGATFGSPGTINLSGQAILHGGATFAATIDGTAPGQYTQLRDTDAQDPAPIELNNNTLSLRCGPNFSPHPGDTLPIFSTASGTISGQFTQVLDAQSGQVIPVNGQSFSLTAGSFQLKNTSTSISLAALVPATATTTRLTSSANPDDPGQSLTFTAMVSTASGPVTTGSVTFSLAGTPVQTVPLDSAGTATYTTSSLPPGDSAITADYTDNTGTEGPSSASLTETIKPYQTTTTLSTSGNPNRPGAPVTFTATVSTASGPVTIGSVTFSLAGVPVQTVPLDGNGTASYTTASLPGGATAVTAAFNGNTGVDLPSSASLMQSVNPYSTSVVLTLVFQKKKHGKKIYELMATVVTTSPAGAAAIPSGSVVFFRKNASLGGVALQSGIAVLAIGGTKPIKKSFTATFQGSPDFTGSTITQVL